MSKRWYVVHVYSGMEKSVHKALNERIERAGLQTSFGRILVPSEEVVEVKGGQKSITERRIFPGYVLVEMDLTDETWHLVKNTNRVTGFWVARAIVRPRFPRRKSKDPLPDGRGRRETASQDPLRGGRDGSGQGRSVCGLQRQRRRSQLRKSKVRVSVTIFGRATPVELDFSQVEKT